VCFAGPLHLQRGLDWVRLPDTRVHSRLLRTPPPEPTVPKRGAGPLQLADSRTVRDCGCQRPTLHLGEGQAGFVLLSLRFCCSCACAFSSAGMSAQPGRSPSGRPRQRSRTSSQRMCMTTPTTTHATWMRVSGGPTCTTRSLTWYVWRARACVCVRVRACV